MNTLPPKTRPRVALDAEAIAKACGGAKRNGGGWVARCPVHNDENPSLSLTDAAGGKVLWHCFAGCAKEAVTEALLARDLIGGNGTVPARTVRHEYWTAEGELKLTVVRKLGPNGKTKRKPGGKGKEITREPKGVKGDYPLYNLSAVLGADPENPILCFEGELKADAAQAAWPETVVTTTVGGAGKARHTDFGPFKGKKVWFVSDDNKPGRAHALECAERAAAAGAIGARVGLAEGDTGLDVHDWLLADPPSVVAERITNLVKPLAWHRDRGPEPQEAMKLADKDGRPALVAVEGGGQPEGATEATGFAPLSRRDKASLKLALSQLGIDVRYNLRTSAHEWDRGGGWAPANDRVDDDIREQIAASFTIAHNGRPALYGRERWATALNSLLCGREVDPFRMWVENLPGWDRVERLSTWLGRAFRTNDDALTRWCSRYIFLGAVERTYRPGCKFDVLPVLVGPQGAGKSSVLALMFPEDRPEWFSDQLNLAADPKVRAEALQGVVLVEVAEMTGSTRAEIQSLKAFLSRTNDGGIRFAWRRNPESMPRRCILVGTSNEAECLPNDWTGLRRFLVVKVDPHDRGAAGAREVMLAERDMLWAEALYLHRGGAAARLPEELEGVQAAANEAHRSGDEVLENELDVYLDQLPAGLTFTLREVGKACLLCDVAGNVSQSNQRKIAGLLRARGFESGTRRIEGAPSRVWMRGVTV